MIKHTYSKTEGSDFIDNKPTFISPLYDSTFKFLWKKESSRNWFRKLIKLITNEDLFNYNLYNPELSSGNKDKKSYSLDILFIDKNDEFDFNKAINIEMYKDYYDSALYKSHAYIFRLLGNGYDTNKNYKKKRAIQVNFINAYCPLNNNITITRYELYDKKINYNLDDLTIYNVYLPKFKGICYNDGDELGAMLSLLQADSFSEMVGLPVGLRRRLV